MEFKKTKKQVTRQALPNTPEPRHPVAPPPPPPAKTLNININFGSLPKNRIPSNSTIISFARRILFTKKALIAGLVVVVLVALWSSFNQYEVAKNSTGNGDSSTIVENLEYQTVLPEGKSISDLGGWRRISPSESDPVYAYLDTLENISISVSQQPLPKSFKGSADDQIAELAKKFNATSKIDAGSTKVYIGTSAKGPQSAIFTKNSLLILIKSQQKINDKAWIKYIASLS